MIKHRIHYSLLILTILLSLMSCDKNEVPDPDIPDNPEAPELTQRVNYFIHEAMDYYYLWYKEMPDINYKTESDSKEYFYSLLYKEKDKWSYITDDIDALLNSFEGIEKTFGWSFGFGEFYDSNENPTGTYFGVVEFVYPNSPAADAGIKRGDIITAINGADITEDNYTYLFDGQNMTFTVGEFSDNGITETSSITLSALELNLNPVVKTSLIEYGGKKIGYMFYAQYIDAYNDALDTALQSLYTQGAQDIVIDLRYNPGGQISAARHLCSILAPKNVVDEESALVTFQWNDKRQNEYESGQNTEDILVSYDNTIPFNYNLNSVHILTGKGTASASELTITGLDPYMEVTTIGDTTYGKYTASITLRPTKQFPNYNEIKNWGLQPIVLQYANAYGVTDFENGFAPNIKAFDDLLRAKPLGDINDPLLAAAIEDITGTPVISAMKSAQIPRPKYRILHRGFSRFDANKRELLLDTKKEFSVQ